MTRVIRKSKQRASGDAAALVSAVFAAELIAPGKCVWVVSPWISDVELIDNTASTFDALEAFGPRHVRLSEVLVTLADSGCAVVIGTTNAASNAAFLARLTGLFTERGLRDLLTIDLDASKALHEKAITTDDAIIVGSMNITRSGFAVREEYLELRTEQEFVTRSRMDAYDRFGGCL